ncbi:hypothetical protein PoB_005364100 [Plakobranchus ocellatus]|uniref:Uncharacterized protein n=1 Tax=Plakobranchus ocellatus TaxID=259542 RepID=A0AAV4C720_9GAST|nr:hypothetical protein PoB_005364100 [Plakobranchus ocellatus]
MSRRAPPNPGQPSAQCQHQRRHHQTFQQPRHNRNQSRAIGLQFDETSVVIRAATVSRIMRGHVMAPPFPLSNRVTDVRSCCKTQRIASAIRQVADLVCACTKERDYFKTCIVGHVNCCLQCGPTLSLTTDRDMSLETFIIHEVNFQVRLEGKNEAISVQPGHRSHHRNCHRHHRRNHNHHQPAANYPLPASTHQSQPQNLQQTQVQPAFTESAGQREALAQLQPLLSDRPAQTQSPSVSIQEPSV